MNFFKKTFIVLILLGLSYVTIKPLLIPGFFQVHDDTQVARVFEMGRALADGLFPARWVADLGYGYGYPIFNFYAPLAYYVGGIITILGVSALNATKVMMGIGILLAGLFMYLLAREFWGRGGGIISAMLYMYSPYHATNIYVRGDVAEFWAYAFIPLVFYGLWKSHLQNHWKFVTIGALGYAGVILAHNLTALMITPFIIVGIVLLFILNKNRVRGLYVGLVFVLGILIAAFYWLPALLEMQYTNVFSQVGGGADFREHFVCPIQLWDSPWGFGGSALGCIDGLSFRIGKIHLGLFLLSVLFSLYVFFRNKLSRYNNTYYYSDRLLIFGFCVLGFLISTLFTLDFSKSFWEAITPMAFIQYPWRFLALSSFFSSFAGGFCLWFIDRVFPKNKALFLLVFFVFAFSIIFYYGKLFAPQTILAKTNNDYINIETLRFNTSRISDEFMPLGFMKPSSEEEVVDEKIVLVKGKADIDVLSEKTQEIVASVSTYEDSELIIHIAYFPSWRVLVDGEDTFFDNSNKGLLINLSQGLHLVKVEFVQTLVQKLGNFVSMAGVLILMIGIIYEKGYHGRKNR